ncbi:hypothetical protein [Sediminitomix flava]|uniref:Uncharacterized protein n=1 Tax=Sediminitomix flava TaxID=379075 RepID=A0A315ZGE9_SEDFL|nr:hypothetical protein [Sediminitomix flava]PWJ44219.1 hypothetical protein BC781_101569 [Sediminitomix flava]
MNLKTGLIFLALFFVNTFSFAQSYKEEIEDDFNDYLSAIISKDFEKSMEYLTPEFFEYIPKKTLLMVMEQTFNNPTLEYELKNPKIIQIEDAQKIDEKYYSFLTYSNEILMRFLVEEKESKKDKRLRIKILQSSLDQSFGKGNVVYNEETDFFELKSIKKVYAISSDGVADWKFLVLEEKQKPLLSKILPKELLEKI